MSKVEDLILKQNIITIPAIVKGRETINDYWEESTNIISTSINTMGITLSRQCQIGHLLCLAPQTDVEVAGNIRFEEDHFIWGIIQKCTLIPGKDLTEKYNVGIAIIGTIPPASYFTHPLQYYRIFGVGENGFWKIEETEKEFITRKHPRFLVSIEAYIGLLGETLTMDEGEKVLTDNISFGGAAVFSNLDLEIGDCVKFIAAKYEFSGLAVVRNLTQLPNQAQRVHLEFLAAKFPIEKLGI